MPQSGVAQFMLDTRVCIWQLDRVIAGAPGSGGPRARHPTYGRSRTLISRRASRVTPDHRPAMGCAEMGCAPSLFGANRLVSTLPDGVRESVPAGSLGGPGVEVRSMPRSRRAGQPPEHPWSTRTHPAAAAAGAVRDPRAVGSVERSRHRDMRAGRNTGRRTTRALRDRVADHIAGFAECARRLSADRERDERPRKRARGESQE